MANKSESISNFNEKRVTFNERFENEKAKMEERRKQFDERKEQREEEIKNGVFPSLKIDIDIDVSSALKGLKAVERQAKKTARALREVETLINK